MQLFIFSVSKTFYSVSIYIFIRFLKNYTHFNWHKVNPIGGGGLDIYTVDIAILTIVCYMYTGEKRKKKLSWAA